MIELTLDEILDDLCWPGPPPGRWNVLQRPDPEPRSAGPGTPAEDDRVPLPVRVGDDHG